MVFKSETNKNPLLPTLLLVAVTTVILASTGLAGDADSGTSSDAVANSVVKIFSTVRYPDYYKPWAKQAPTEISGSGVVIKGKRILTNAHVVQYASQVQVQANQSGNVLPATVEAVAPDMDLAVLKLDDDAFFDSHPPLKWAAKIPSTETPVMVYGYPVGGTGLSITKGIVSRIEFTSYGSLGGLRIQIDAAINAGNSGGPAVVDNKMAGIAFSRLTGTAQNIGYIIPCEEIQLFLDDVADGHYDGKAVMMDEFQGLDNSTMRSFLNLDSSTHGVVVIRPDSFADAYPLKKWDVITKIGGTRIDDQGMVNLNDDLRVYFKYLIQKTIKDGEITLTVLRSGKEMQIKLPLGGSRQRLIPELNGTYPSYFVYGPIVFSTATTGFLGGLSTGTQGAVRLSVLGFMNSPLVSRLGEYPSSKDQGLVVVSSPFFPHKIARGYANPAFEVVKSVNGIPIKNLGHLVEVLRDCKEKFVTFEFYGTIAPIIVFPRAEIAAATEQILLDNDIRSQGSPDTMAIWNARSAVAN